MWNSLIPLIADARLVPKWTNWNMFPESNSTFGPAVDGAFNFIMWVSIFFFVLITILLIAFPIMYRRRDPSEKLRRAPSHNTPLEIFWTVIPSILLVIMFARGFAGYVDMRTPPADAYEINVIGKKWAWSFQYKNGYIDPDLHVPVDTPVRLVMTSDDVIHSLFIPTFRVKMDVVPGKYTYAWFHALNPGQQHLFCTEYCGQKHSDMIARCIVHPKEADPAAADDPGMEAKQKAFLDLTFDQWLAYASDIKNRFKDAQGNFDPIAAGSYLYTSRGCNGCHSIDGSPLANGGPSFLNLARDLAAAKMIPLQGGGEVVADENYVRESILNPMAKIHAGYPARMPSFAGQLKDEEIAAIISFIKNLDAPK